MGEHKACSTCRCKISSLKAGLGKQNFFYPTPHPDLYGRWLWRGGSTRSHPELGSENPLRGWYCRGHPVGEYGAAGLLLTNARSEHHARSGRLSFPQVSSHRIAGSGGRIGIHKRMGLSRRVTRVSRVFSCRSLGFRGRRLVVVSGGMARAVDEERAGVRCRERQGDGSAAGGHPRFLQRDADRSKISAAHRNKLYTPPDARSGKPIRSLRV